MIKGLTDRGMGFPEIGSIRKGIRVINKEGNEHPSELNYFRVIFDEKETETAEKFISIYKNQPTEIDVFLPFNEIEKCWDAWCEAYTAGRMVARSDGEYFLFYSNAVNFQSTVNIPDVINGLDKNGNKVPHVKFLGTAGKSKVECVPTGRLKVIIPGLQRLAYLVVHTGSITDIRNISEQLHGLQMLNGGQIVGVPLILRRRPKMISVPNDDGTRRRLKKWMISIEADPTWVAKKIMQVSNAALPSGFEKLSLPSKIEDDIEEVDGDWGEAEIEEEIDDSNIDEEGLEISEPEPVKTTQTTPVSSPLRLKPEDLKEAIEKKAEKMTGKISNGKRGVVVSMLESILSMRPDPKEARHQLLHYLTGKSSINEIPDSVILALYEWLKPTQDTGGAWIPDAMATREALTAYNASQPAQSSLL